MSHIERDMVMDYTDGELLALWTAWAQRHPLRDWPLVESVLDFRCWLRELVHEEAVDDWQIAVLAEYDRQENDG